MDVPGGRNHLANATIAKVGNKKISSFVEKYTVRGAQLGRCCGTPVAAEAWRSIAGNSLDNSSGSNYFADTGVASIAHKDISRAIDEHPSRSVQFSAGRRPSIAAKTLRSGPGYRLDIPSGRNHFPNAVVVGIREEDVSFGIDVHANRKVEFGLERGV